MADWSDLVGMTLRQARNRALEYNHDIAVVRIAEKNMKYDINYARGTVLVETNESGEAAIVIAQYGTEHPNKMIANKQ